MNFKEHVMRCNIGSSSEGMEITSSESSLDENGEESRLYIDLQSVNETDNFVNSQRTFGEGKWNGILKEDVTFLPHDIDGLKIYSIKSLTCAKLLKSLRDGRPWEKDTKTQ